MSEALEGLEKLGVSIWLDDLSRSRLTSGNLQSLITTKGVRGVTTNPAIFEKAISSGGAEYAADLVAMAKAGASVDGVIRELTTSDVRAACDVFAGVYAQTQGQDGRVSIEVDPRLAHDTATTVQQAIALHAEVDRPNVMIKIPATSEGLSAITQVTAKGISVNATLIFSVDRYRAVVHAYEEGVKQAAASGIDVSTIHSVASFFVSRVDSAVDKQLDALAEKEPNLADRCAALRGKAAIANAILAWQEHLTLIAQPAWQELAAKGANAQRPLWASTGVKDPAYDDTRYVMDLAVGGSVNTMPEATLDAVIDHGVFRGDTVTGRAAEAQKVWEDLESLGIKADIVCADLEKQGVQLFIDSWEKLRSEVSTSLANAQA